MAICLFVVAHEDDETINLGPAILNHYNGGHTIYTLVCSDGGNTGVWDNDYPSAQRPEFCQHRLDEFDNASSELGVSGRLHLDVRTTGNSIQFPDRVGYNGLIRDGYLNLGAYLTTPNANHDTTAPHTTSPINGYPGYYGNEMGSNYYKVNTDLYNGIKSVIIQLANAHGTTPDQIRVKTHSHIDAHADHRAVCQAVLRLYYENFITDVRHYVPMGQWDSYSSSNGNTYAGVSFPYASAYNASIEAPSGNLTMIDNAIGRYVRVGSNISTIQGSADWGIGYMSAGYWFEQLAYTKNKISYRILPPAQA